MSSFEKDLWMIYMHITDDDLVHIDHVWQMGMFQILSVICNDRRKKVT